MREDSRSGGRSHGRRIGVAVIVASALVAVGAVAGGLLWRQYAALPTGLFVDSVARFREDVAALPGVSGLEPTESRMGDLGSGSNAFVPILTDLALADPTLMSTIDATAARAALAQTHTRIMPVLRVEAASIGLTAEHALNTTRVRIAQEALAVDGVVAVSVLWPDQGDDLIFDESNERLHVSVQCRSGSPAALADAVRPVVQQLAPDASLTAIELTDPAVEPRTHLYSWSERDRGISTERTVVTATAPLPAALHGLIDQLDSDDDVLGYRLGTAGAYLYVPLGADAAALAGRLALPVGMTELTIETIDDGRLLPPVRWSVDPASGALTTD